MGKATVKSPAKNRNRKTETRLRRKAPDSEEKSEFVEVVAEGGDHVEPAAAGVVEPDPECRRRRPSRRARTIC
jgi:putative ATP-binding cassette transporter